MTASALMIQGTGSDVGKSVLVAGLCRALVRRGHKVAPFKPQNMSNNAAVTADGGEIGRAQALQAMACGLEPSVLMNPVLLKPETDTGAQVVVRGRRQATVAAKDYAKLKPGLLKAVLDSFDELRARVDYVIVEGAGSPAEINLRRCDIANMGFAEAAGLPAVLVGDIDRGGVIAQLVGTRQVIGAEDADRIKGFIINKFRGDPDLFSEGYRTIEAHTGWSGFGIVPWLEHCARLPAEDAVQIRSGGQGAFKVAVPHLSRIANFDDLDPLKLEPGVTVDIVEAGRPLPGDADLVLLPGTKSTIGELKFFRKQGWDIDLKAHHRRGGRILGLCGGYQMLGRSIADPEGIEGAPGQVDGLGFLDVETVMKPEKRLARISGTHIASGEAVSGYEIHIGETSGTDCDRPVLTLEGRSEGATSADGLVSGVYLHGLFAEDRFRAAYLSEQGVATGGVAYTKAVDDTLDRLADHLERHVDVNGLLSLFR